MGSAFPTAALAASPDGDVTSDVLGNSLVGKAEDALSRYLAGDLDGAIGRLNSLIDEVDVQQGKQLSYDEAASVRNGARQLIDTIRTG